MGEGQVLTQAFNQWASRPKDERYGSLADLHQAVVGYRAQAREAREVPWTSLRAEARDGDIVVVGKQGTPATMTNWSFGQLSKAAGAPPSYLEGLSAELAVENLNYGLAGIGGQRTTKLLLHTGAEDGSEFKVRAFTGKDYARIWNSDITSRLIRLTEQNPQWQPAPAAFDGSRGLYASDHDMFAFMVDSNRRIFEKAPGGGLGRGFFVSNSEVGAKSFWVLTFLYEYCCGNHRVWGAQGVRELRIRHAGNADERAFAELEVELKNYADSSAQDDEAKVQQARRTVLGRDKDEVLDKIFGLRVPVLSRKLIGEGYDRAELHSDWYGDPKTVWGLAGGLTEVARDMAHADKRVEVERAAGKVMQIAF